MDKEKIKKLAEEIKEYRPKKRINTGWFKKGTSNWVGRKHSEETKKKMSIIKLNNPSRYFLGKKFTEEHKEKIRNGRRKKFGIWIFKCSICKKEKKISPSDYKVRKFCSMECSKQNMTFSALKRMVKIRCKRCKKIFSVPKNKVKRKKYCSKKCMLVPEAEQILTRRHNSKIRKYRIKNIIGSYRKVEWEKLKKKNKYTCLCCGQKEPKIKLTIDHIIPVSRGGTNYINNLQPLCSKCNRFKYTKIIKYESH